VNLLITLRTNMIQYANGGVLIQELSELPSLAGAKNIFFDLETTSGDPKITSLNPWQNCSILGLCVTVDDCSQAYYIPVGHETGNLAKSGVYYWIADILQKCDQWINHNIKYDVNIYINSTSHQPTCKLVDTLTLAKILDSDRFRYGLKHLSKEWLEEDISQYESAMEPYLYRNKDYGKIPADIMAEYGAQDVLTNRRLFNYLRRRCPEECRQIWDMEILLTPALIDIEQEGLCIDTTELTSENYISLYKLLKLEAEIEKLIGSSMRPNANTDCFDLLCNQYGLPVLAYTEKGEPSFDKDALRQYLMYPGAPKDVIELCLKYRTLHTINSLFLEPWLRLQVNGKIHPQYKQTVRTGRMACGQPNIQQLNPTAKHLIHAKPEHHFISIDYAQIEFRLIVHYIQDQDAIEAYKQDPNTDFHLWMAKLCGIPRKPAKTVNFSVAYGAGQKTIVRQLANNMDLMEGLDANKNFNEACQQRAQQVYAIYHSKLPGLKITSRAASQKARSRGYVFNAYGRRRHLPQQVAHIAFNSIIQSCAADVMKDRLVAVAPRYNDIVRNAGWTIVASVHDELVFQVPNNSEDITEYIRKVLEAPVADFRVPIKVDIRDCGDRWG